MSSFRSKLLITLALLTVVVVTSGTAAYAGLGLQTISEHDESPVGTIGPIGDCSGEPDVGQTSPSSGGRVQGQSALRGVSGFDDAVRIAVWIWKARFGLTGF